MKDVYETRYANARKLMELNGYKYVTDLINLYGATQGYLNNILGNNPSKNIGEKAARKLEAIFNVEPYYLDKDHSQTKPRGTTPQGNAKIIGGFETWDENTPLRDDEVELPFYTEVALSAGTGKLANEDGKIRTLRFSKVSLGRLSVDKSSAVCVKVNGNSMEPVLNDGDTVGIDTANTTIKNGKTYAIRHGDEVRIKTLYNAPMNGLRIVSFNADEYPPENYTAEQIEEQGITVIGKVFWSSTLWD